MDSDSIIVQIASESGPARVGLIESSDARSSKRLTVNWADGASESIELSKTIVRARRGSLVHRRALDSESVRRIFETDPTTVFLAAMLEFDGGPKSVEQLTGIVAANTGISSETVTTVWTRSKKEILANPDVKQSGSGKALKLKWAGGPVIGADSSTIAEPIESANPSEPAATAAAVDAEEPKPVDSDWPVDSDSEPQDTSEVQGPTAEVLAGSTESRPIEDLEQLLSDQNRTKQPLEWATRVLAGGLDPVLELDAENPERASALAIAPKLSKTAETRVKEWASSESALGFLRAAALESLATQPPVHLPSLYQLLERVAPQQLESTTLLPLVLSVRALAQDKSTAGTKRTVASIDMLRAAMARHGIESVSREIGHLLRSIGHIEFAAKGGRSALLALVHGKEPKLVESLNAWEGLTWNSLIVSASGALQPVLANPVVREKVVQPLIDDAIARLGRRAEFGELLGAPKVIVESIRPDTIARLARTVAESDSMMATWMTSLSREDEIQALRAKLQAAESRAVNAETQRADARAAAALVEEALTQAESRLSEAAKSNRGLIDAERRQLVLDGLQVVAQLAATAEQETDGPNGEALVKKLWSLSSRVGVVPFEKRGDTVAFDPSHHRSPGERPQVGERVIVARSGYKWEDGSESLVLVPAVVARIQ